MESEGYKVRWDTHQNILYESVTGWQCRDRLLFEDRYLKEAMEREFQIRAEIIHGRTDGDEPSATYPPTGTETGRDSAYAGAFHRDPLSAAGGDGATGTVPAQPEKLERTGGDVSERTLGDALSASDTDADRRTTGGGEASGGDDSTGWEKEREAFFSSQAQTAQTAPSGLGWADGGYGGDGVGYGGIASALVQIGRRLEQSQFTAPVSDSTTQYHHADSKTLRKEKQKKIALGHKADDHEDEENYNWQQTM